MSSFGFGSAIYPEFPAETNWHFTHCGCYRLPGLPVPRGKSVAATAGGSAKR